MLARIRKSIEEKDQGFTLIELLVVMIIIGILAAIAIPVFLNQRKKAVDSGIKSDLRTIAQQEETYYTDNSNYKEMTTKGSSVTVGDAVKTSAGNEFVITLVKGTGAGSKTTEAAKDATGFCIAGTNPKSSDASFIYNSQDGGLKVGGKAGATDEAKCPA